MNDAFSDVDLDGLLNDTLAEIDAQPDALSQNSEVDGLDDIDGLINDAFSDLDGVLPPVEAPKQTRLESAGSNFVKGAANVVASIPKAIDEGGKVIEDYLGIEGPTDDQGNVLPIEDRSFYKMGDVVSRWADTFETNPDYEGEFTQDLASGAGSLAAFVAGGFGGALAKVPGWLGASILGATSEGSGAVEEYKHYQEQYGLPIDDEVRGSVFLQGIPGGLTEGLPIGRALDRLDNLTGGGVKAVLKEGVKGGIEELTQEVIQSIMGNWNAQVHYDEDRNLFEGTQRGGEVGFTLGFLLNTLTASVGARRARLGKQNDEQGTPPTESPDNAPNNAEDLLGGAPDSVSPESEPLTAESGEVASQGTTDHSSTSIIYADPRLKREEFRDKAAQLMETDLVEGGGSAIIDDPNFVAGESDKPGEAPQVRTPSLNPKWVQELLSGTGMSVKQVRNAVNKAVNGEKLGTRQTSAVLTVLDHITGERTTDSNLDYMKRERQRAREFRQMIDPTFATQEELAGQGTPAPTEEPGWLYEEDAYEPELNYAGRVIQELADKASAINEEATFAILERQVPDSVIAEQLAALIQESTPNAQEATQPAGNSLEPTPEELGYGLQADLAQQGAGQPAGPEPYLDRPTQLPAADPAEYGLDRTAATLEETNHPLDASAAQPEADLFGDVPIGEQDLADAVRQVDEKLAGEPVPVESGEGDLFSGKSKQTDIADIATPKGLEVEFEGQRYPVNSFAEASNKFREAIDQAGIGSRDLSQDPVIYENGKQVAHISYNGKVWKGKAYKQGAKPLYTPGQNDAGVDSVQLESNKTLPGDRRTSPHDDSEERRADKNTRKAVADMTETEMREALLVDDLTGIGNRRAWDEAEKLAHVASIDVDSLKWVNDNMGHESGDMLLKAVGEALGKTGNQVYHISGDEFVAQWETEDGLKNQLEKVRENLSKAVIEVTEPDGTVIKKTGVEFSYGIAKTLKDAEQGLQKDKADREKSGERAGRGEEPAGVSRRKAEGQQDNESNPAEVEARPERISLKLRDETPDSHEIVKEINEAVRWVNGLSDQKYYLLLDMYGDNPAGMPAFPQGVGLTSEPLKLLGIWKSHLSQKDKAATKSTAPEHQGVGVDERELGEIVDEFKSFQDSMHDDDYQITHVFDPPAKKEIVRLNDKVKVYNSRHGWMSVEEAKKRIDEWEENAVKQGKTSVNSQRVVISLFDLTGAWSLPWEQAGYEVYRFDIQNVMNNFVTDEETGEDKEVNIGDINEHSFDMYQEVFGMFEGKDVYAILAACPCTDFAVSGARHFAAKDADGRTVASVKLVHQTLNVIEYFKPAIWAVENPVGRIERLGSLPPWRLSFDPNHLGETYTKKTLLWGRFNADLPIAPVDPVEGSKMHKKYGGKSLATKNARSATPEGFSYGFFMANNAVDHPVLAIHGKYDRLDKGQIERAVKLGITEQDISDAVDDFYYSDLNDEAADEAIAELIAEREQENAKAKRTKGAPESALKKKPTTKAEKQAGNTAYDSRVNDLNERAIKFGIDKTIDFARSSRAGAILGREFNESVEDYLDRNPDIKGKYEATGDWLKDPKSFIEAHKGKLLAIEANKAATSPKNDTPQPTEAQKEAGNYKKGHVTINGLDIAIENPAGSKRNPEWPALKHHYGYIKKTEGADGDHVDVFIGKKAEEASKVFVIDQIDKSGKFDEHKVVIGPEHEEHAKNMYLANYGSGWSGLGAIKEFTLDEFKTWLEGDTTKPVSYKEKPHMKGVPEAARRKPKNIGDTADLFGGTLDETVSTGKNNERLQSNKLDIPGKAALGRVQADNVRGAKSGGNTGQGAGTGGKEDSGRNGRADGQRDGLPGRVGSGAREVSVSTGSLNLQVTADNYIITDADDLGAGGQKTKYKNNVAAIRVLKDLDQSGEQATPEQQAILVKYVGWGGIPQAFDPRNAKWSKEYAELKDLFTEDEFAAARRSTQDAHYTAPAVVRGIYKAVAHLGFKGGRIIEPSVGTGNFLGLMPAAIRGPSRVVGIELDPTTGAIAKHLYPKFDIHPGRGYQDISVPDNHFDMAIGNPPFGKQSVFDKAHKDLSKLSIHNYFFLKSLAKLRPGGIQPMVVSNFLLDAKDSTAREMMAKQAKLLGAIRLPNNAFLKNAGTEVTTDIVFLQKLEEGESNTDTSWTGTTTIPDPATGKPITINQYFADHPEMMLGEMRLEGSMYGPDSAALVGPEGQNIEQAINEAIASLPANAYTPASNNIEKTQPEVMSPPSSHVKVFGYAVNENGEIVSRLPDELDEQVFELAKDLSATAIERIKGMIHVRDTLRDLMNMEISPDINLAKMERARESLNKVYDNFARKYGAIHSVGNRRAFIDDPDYPLLLSLENNYDKGMSAAVAKKKGEVARKPSWDKAAIFTRRIRSPYRIITSADSAEDALKIVLAEAGRVDTDRMQELTGKDEDTLLEELKGLVFRDPEAGLVTADEYLSGNVKQKLAVARAQAANSNTYRDNVAALEEVQPEDVEAVDIDVRLGSPWIPAKEIAKFINELLGIDASIAYIPAIGKWSVGDTTQGDNYSGTKNNEQWGTQRYSAIDLIKSILGGKAIVVKDKAADGGYFTNEEETQSAMAKAEQLRDEFADWIWRDEERRRVLARHYNDTFNTNRLREYDGSHLTLPGMSSEFTMRPHQLNAIWRLIQDGKGLLDHVVGAGKTFVMISAGMEMRRMGLSRKPMYIVPNHLVGQWAADFAKLYPGANVLAATKKDFEKGNRQKLFARIATGDWDAVIVAHSSFERIKMPSEEQERFLKEQVSDISNAIETLKAEGGQNRSVKQMEKTSDALESKLKELAEAKEKDDVVDFAELGVDTMYLDEAHEYKNLFYATSMNNVAGLGTSKGSQKAFDMFVKTQYLQRINNDKGVIFATGTPISNTMAELFTMQRYLQSSELKSRGLGHFDAWANVFGNVTSAWELDATGVNYKLQSRFAKFVNMPELLTMYRTFADTITRDDIKRQLAEQGKRLPIPGVKGGKPENVIVDRSPEQEAYMMDIIHRAQNRPSDPREDNMLKITNDARKMALDMRLVDPEAEDNENSKTSVATRNILARYKQWHDKKGTQLVFIDLSTPKNARGKQAAELREIISKAESGDEAAIAKMAKLSMDDLLAVQSSFSVYDDLREKLVKAGIPDGEIRFIHQANTDKQKEDLFDSVNRGDVRVLIGSTAKMGAGMNVQKRLIALHHLDAPWRPSDIEQREGRIIRQGNGFFEADPDNFEVEVMRYATEKTYDARMWQTLEVKARFIEQLRAGDVLSRTVEDIASEAANFAELKASATGNPLILEQVRLAADVRKLDGLATQHKRKIQRLQDAIHKLRDYESRYETDVRLIKKDIATRDANTPPTGTFSIEVNGKTYKDKKTASSPIELAIVRFMKDQGQDSTLLGKYRGFNVSLHKSMLSGNIFLQVEGEFANYSSNYSKEDTISGGGFITRLDNIFKGMDDRLTDRGKQRDRDAGELSDAKTEVEKPFTQANEHAEAKQQQQWVMAELKRMEKDDYDPMPVDDVLAGKEPPPKPEKDNEKPSFSFNNKPASSGFSVTEVEEAIAPVLLTWQAGHSQRIEVIQSEDSLPDHLREELDESRGDRDVSGKGVYDGTTNTIYLIAGNIDGKQDALRVLAHEAVGHLAMEEMLGKEFQSIVKQVQLMKVAGNKKITEIAQEVHERYGSLDKDTQSKEIIAVMAEKGINNSTMKRILAALRKFLRKLGFRLQFSSTELEAMIANAESYLRTNKPKANAGTTGSRANFSRANPTFYSQMQRVLGEKLPGSGSAAQLKAQIMGMAKKGQFKQEELEWSGLSEWLDEQPGKKVSKQAIIDFLQANEIQVQEVKKVQAQDGLDDVSIDDLPDDVHIQDAVAPIDGYFIEDDEGNSLTATYSTSTEAIQAYLNDGIVDTTKFSGYQLPGGENYRELLLTLPIRKTGEKVGGILGDIVEGVTGERPDSTNVYKGSHYDEPNILAHIRFNERTDADGKRVLFVEEVQSDWHQAGRRSGYKTKPSDSDIIKKAADARDLLEKGESVFAFEKTTNTYVPVTDSRGNLSAYITSNIEHYVLYKGEMPGSVPDAPFKTTWPLLAMKRMIRYAAENGFDSVAWTTGEQQADRYDLSEHIKSIEYEELTPKRYGLKITDINGDRVHFPDSIFDEAKLEETVGKEIAEKIANDEGRKVKGSTFKVLDGLDLKVGGEGMKGFYDNILPKTVNKYVKKWGAKVGRAELDSGEVSPYVIDAEDPSLAPQVQQEVIVRNRVSLDGVAEPFDNIRDAEEWIEEREEQMDATVHSINITDQMREAVMQGQPLFALDKKNEVPEAQSSALEKYAKGGQPMDRMFRVMFKPWLNEHGVFKPGAKFYDKAKHLIEEGKFDEDGMMSFMNPIFENARAGLIDRHGLSDEFIKREFEASADERKMLLEAADLIEKLKDNGVNSVAEAKVFQAILTGEEIDNADWNSLAAPIRKAIDEMGQEAVSLGLISAESYERNKGTYLHRVYMKHESDKDSLGKWASKIMNKRRKQIVGDNLKGRGMDLNVTMANLTRATPQEWWGRKLKDGLADPRLKGFKFRVFDRMQAAQGTETLEGFEKGGPKPKVQERVYWPSDMPVPAKYEAWTDRGLWEVRTTKKDKAVLWRDYTKDERESMGEILDARYTLAKTYQLMAHNLSTGRFLRDIAKNDQWATNHEPPAGSWTNPKGRLSTYSGYEWVKVPGAEIPGTGGAKKWGALAGMYVRSEIWRDLNELDRMQMPGFWKGLMTQWKLNKTARNPVVHMNNIMSNFLFMDMADIRLQDLGRALLSIRNKDEHYQDALAHGAFGAGYVEHELKRDVLDRVIEEIAQQNKMQRKGGAEAYMDSHGMTSKIAVLGKFADVMWGLAKKGDEKLTSWYQLEDEVFRMATYMRRRGLGDDVQTAAQIGRDQFLNYDIRAPWVNAARQSFLPFISYTYRAVPVVAKSIAERPWKLAKYATVAYALNALGYAMAPGDEDEERRSLREDQQGNTWLGMPRMIRMPYRDAHGNPVFLDIRRWIPAGDVFDFNQSKGAIKVPAPLQFGGPLMLAAELALNKQAFTGKEIVNWKTSDWKDATGDVTGWAWRSWMPSAPWIPGGWYWNKIESAINGGRDSLGREYNLPLAVASSLGVKVKAHDVKQGFRYKARDIEAVKNALLFEFRELERDHRRKLISADEYLKERERLKKKMKQLDLRAKETFGK